MNQQISIIGPGRHGTTIAQLFAAHGVDVVLHHHRPAKAEAARAAVAAVAQGASVRVAATALEAARASDVVALTTLWDAPQREVLAEIGEAMVGKVLLDVSNPLDVTPTGIRLRVPAEGSAGQFVATLLPTGVGHAKAFSNMSTATILSGADHTPPAVMPFLADSAATAAAVEPLLAATGWHPRYSGDISHSRDIEIGGAWNDIHGRWGRSALDPQEFEATFGPAPTPAS